MSICPICNFNACKQIINKSERSVINCPNCDIHFFDPLLTLEENSSLYTDNYLDYTRLDIGLRESRRVIYSAEMAYIEKLCPSRSAQILDIGCSDGSFLKDLKAKGYNNLFGNEIIPAAAERAKKEFGNHIFAATLKECRFEDGSFDMITMWDVLDQLLDPLSEIKEVNRILKKNGVLIIRVRNMDSHMPFMRLNVLLKALHLPKIPTLMHVFGFNKKSLKYLLEKNGLFIIRAKNSRLTAGDPYGSPNSVISFITILSKILVNSISQIISILSANRLFLSPSIIVYARKGR